MRQLTHTLTVYGTAGAVLGAIAAVTLLAGSSPHDSLPYLIPVVLVFGVAALVLDVFGALCVALAWLPFAAGFFHFTVSVATIDLYAASMTALAAIGLVRLAAGHGTYPITAIDFVVAGLCFTFLASTLLAADIVQSGYLAFHSLFVPVVSYIAVKSFIGDNERYKQAMGFLVVGIAVFAMFGIVHFLHTESRLKLFGVDFIGVATLGVTGFFLTVYSGWWKRWPWKIVAGLSLIMLVVTYSRMYMLMLLLSPVVVYFVRRGRAFLMVVGLFLLSLTGTVLVASNAQLFRPTHSDIAIAHTAERLTSVGLWKSSVYGRALTYEQGLATFLQNPVFGTGLTKGEYVITQHDFNVEWLEYGGIIGYLLYASVFLVHFFRAGRRAPEDRFLVATLTVLLVILMNSVTNGIMHGMMPYVVFLLIGFGEARLGFAASAPKQTAAEEDRSRPADRGLVSARDGVKRGTGMGAGPRLPILRYRRAPVADEHNHTSTGS